VQREHSGRDTYGTQFVRTFVMSVSGIRERYGFSTLMMIGMAS
jgi:hypothetical protein